MQDDSMYDPELGEIIAQAFDRLRNQLKEAGPYLHQRISDWMLEYFKTDHPEEAFKSPQSFPVLLLPWFAEKKLTIQPDAGFQSDLVYSTVNGYCYIRFIDNLMDGHRQQDLKLLPALNFFHTQFQSPYLRYFGCDHPFWERFTSTWLHSAEVTLRDAELKEIDFDTFVKVCAQKTTAAKIPLMAVCYRYESPAQIQDWERWIDLFGCWHQMWNDIFDWVKDTRQTTLTYFLSEAERRRKTYEPVVDWVIREGFDWGMGLLDSWMLQLKDLAHQVGSPELELYLVERSKVLENQKARTFEKLEELEKLLTTLKRALKVDEI